MADEQRLPPRIYLMKKRLLRVLKIRGDCMERLIRSVAWLTTWSNAGSSIAHLVLVNSEVAVRIGCYRPYAVNTDPLHDHHKALEISWIAFARAVVPPNSSVSTGLSLSITRAQSVMIRRCSGRRQYDAMWS